MRLKELLEAAGYESRSASDVEICGITADSRHVREGYVFVAIKGLRSDGHLHISEALSRGAVFVVAQRQVLGVSMLVVNSTREALARLLDAWHHHPTKGLTLIGITGTNGKTSTAAMLYEILGKAGKKCGLIGTVTATCDDEPLTLKGGDRLANFTTPDPEQLYPLLAQMRDLCAECVVMEVTSHALFFEKVAPLRFSRAVFTNLTPDHLDLHGDMTSYFLEKRKLFLQSEMGIISLFSPYGQQLADSLETPFLTVGRGNVQQVKASGDSGVCFSLFFEGKSIDVSLPVPGDFTVENAALAAMTALSLGVPGEVVVSALAGFGGVRGRMERVGENALGISVFLDYAHTPDALEKLLLSVRRFRRQGQRIILLFGCGGDRDRSKRRKMGRIASRLADLSIITSDNARGEDPTAIIADILKGIDKEKPYKIVVDRREAIAFAIEAARKGDIVLLAGKGHEEYEIRGRDRLPFSERQIVKECLEKRAEGEFI